MTGYYNDVERTKETIDSTRWLNTGDQFVLHKNGYGNIIGRTKDMIIRGGENIFPVDIEHFLESHPLITQVQVYGVPSERMGEEVCASISHFKIPKYIFIEKGEFPKTRSGEVKKFLLKEIALRQIRTNIIDTLEWKGTQSETVASKSGESIGQLRNEVINIKSAASRHEDRETILNSFKTQLITGKERIPNDRPILEDRTHETEVESSETSGGGKEGCVALNEVENLEAPPNSNIDVVFER
ncbi:AMP-dependent synthetase/ligase [Cinara cedri]|uniref:AMP-dependent synthetase/ligase n=1 Tax=Cinara cedri TaxID=506608 RepID=A0A5E4MVF9_9HEMI|nr:AMP-dependent synthetase/ligase [Cinara cedri]